MRPGLNLQPIDAPDDPRLEPYRDVRERDLVGRQGRFVIEGRVVLEKAVASVPACIESVMVAEPRLAGLAPILSGLEDGTPVYVAGQAVMDAIVGFPIHRGILAIGRRAEIAPESLLGGLGPDALVVALAGIANHDNMGGIFRNAAAFGADAVLVDGASCDPLYRKAIRVSVGAAVVTPFARVPAGVDMVGLLAAAGLETVALTPGGATALADFRPPRRIAALFGAEGPGLPAEVLARTATVRIDMAGGWDSLNVATTSGIVLHHLATTRRQAPARA